MSKTEFNKRKLFWLFAIPVYIVVCSTPFIIDACLKKNPIIAKITLSNEKEVKITNASSFSSLCSDSSSTSQVTINGTTFTKDDVTSFQFEQDFNLTTIGNNFLSNCIKLEHINAIPSSVTTIGNNFLSNCLKFNSKITADGVVSIGNNFLTECDAFNSSFNILEHATTIGDHFLSDCNLFNTTFTINSCVTTIGNNFLADCTSFKEEINCPENDARYSGWSEDNAFANCMAGDYSALKWTSPSIIYKPHVYDSILTLINSTTIRVNTKEDFEKLCTNSNQDTSITIGSNTFQKKDVKSFSFEENFYLPTIPNDFLRYFTSLDCELLIPSCVTVLGTYFLCYCKAFNNGGVPFELNIAEAPEGFMVDCTGFNQEIKFYGLKKTSYDFMMGCDTFNQELKFMEKDVATPTLQFIGYGFMKNCDNFKNGGQPLTFCSSITSIGPQFLQGCFTFDREITFPSTILTIDRSVCQECLALTHVTVTGLSSKPNGWSNDTAFGGCDNRMWLTGWNDTNNRISWIA